MKCSEKPLRFMHKLTIAQYRPNNYKTCPNYVQTLLILNLVYSRSPAPPFLYLYLGHFYEFKYLVKPPHLTIASKFCRISRSKDHWILSVNNIVYVHLTFGDQVNGERE